MSKMQRTKGANGERELCALLTEWLGQKVTRNLGQARDGGNDITLDPFRIEVKRRKRIASLYEWLEQARIPLRDWNGIYPVPMPVVMCRSDNEGWLVVMRFNDWVTLAREEIVKGDGNGATD